MREAGDNDDKKFRTLRGFLSGDEPNEQNYFNYSATLRIFGEIQDLDEITRRVGVSPTYTHRIGDRHAPDSPPHKHDMWSYTAPINKTEPLEAHIDALWSTFRDHKQYLLELKRGLKVTMPESKCVMRVSKCLWSCRYPSGFQSLSYSASTSRETELPEVT